MTAKQNAATNEAIVIKLPSKFTIAEVALVKHKLEAALDSGCPIIVDAKHVERVDTAALQLMAAFWQIAPVEGIQIIWDGVPDMMRGAANDLGLSHLMRF